MTADALAGKTELNSRYLREWLATMATAEYVEYHPEEDSFSLSAEQATVFTGDSPGLQAGRFQVMFSLISAAEGVARAESESWL